MPWHYIFIFAPFSHSIYWPTFVSAMTPSSLFGPLAGSPMNGPREFLSLRQSALDSVSTHPSMNQFWHQLNRILDVCPIMTFWTCWRFIQSRFSKCTDKFVYLFCCSLELFQYLTIILVNMLAWNCSLNAPFRSLSPWPFPRLRDRTNLSPTFSYARPLTS